MHSPVRHTRTLHTWLPFPRNPWHIVGSVDTGTQDCLYPIDSHSHQWWSYTRTFCTSVSVCEARALMSNGSEELTGFRRRFPRTRICKPTLPLEIDLIHSDLLIQPMRTGTLYSGVLRSNSKLIFDRPIKNVLTVLSISPNKSFVRHIYFLTESNE